MKLIHPLKSRLQYFKLREKVRLRYWMLVRRVALLVVQYMDKKSISTCKPIVDKTTCLLSSILGFSQTSRDKIKTLILW